MRKTRVNYGERKCDHCGEVFLPKISTGRFCSPGCKGAYHFRRRMRMAKHCETCPIWHEENRGPNAVTRAAIEESRRTQDNG